MTCFVVGAKPLSSDLHVCEEGTLLTEPSPAPGVIALGKKMVQKAGRDILLLLWGPE